MAEKILLPDDPSGNWAPTPQPTVPQKTDLWGNLGAGGYSALNEATLGLPDFLVKTFTGEADPNSAYNQLKQLRAEHQIASQLGGGTGTIGSMFIPGGSLVKGLGNTARGLGAVKTGNALLDAAKVLRGTGEGAQGLKALGQGALQGAGTAAEQGLVRVATGNEDIEDLPLSIGLGGLGGAAVKGIASKLKPEGAIKGGTGESGAEFGANELRDLANKATLSSVGIDTRSLRKAINSSGLKSASSKVANADDYVGDIAGLIRERGIYSKRGFSALLKEAQDDFANIERGFTQNAPKDWNKQLARALNDDTELLTDITDMNVPAAEDFFTKTVNDIANAKDPTAVRNRLGKFIRDRMTSPNPDDRATARVASSLKSKIDDFVADNSGLAPEILAGAKFKWKALQPWFQQEAKDATSLNKIFAGGSPTFEKTEINELLQRLGGQGLAGAGTGAGLSVAGDLSQGNDVNLGNAAMASLVGGVAPGLIAKAGNKALSRVGRSGASILANENLMGKLVKAGDAATEAAFTQGAPMAGKLAAATVKTMNDEPKSVQDEKKAKDDLEAASAPEEVEAAKQTLAEEIRPQMMAHLQQIYTKFYYDRDPQAFMEAVLTKTKNFTDPEMTAKLLFVGDPEEQRKYIRRYNDHLAVSKLELMNAEGKPGKAITGFNFGLPLMQDEEYKTLRKIMIDNAAQHDVNKIAAATKDVDRDLKLVRDNPALLDTLLTSPKYGLNFQDLKDRGVI